jgi:hypothetical protein
MNTLKKELGKSAKKGVGGDGILGHQFIKQT